MDLDGTTIKNYFITKSQGVADFEGFLIPFSDFVNNQRLPNYR